jgi:hypothetical protein
MRNTLPCVTVERVVLWIQYSVSDMGWKERLETALSPMLALWLLYLLQLLDIAMYPTVQVAVVRNSYVLIPYARFVATILVAVIRYSYEYVSYNTSYSR